MRERLLIGLIAVVVVGAFAFDAATGDTSEPPVTTTTTLAPVERVWPEPVVRAVDVTGTRPGVAGVMMVQGFSQQPRTSGPATEQLRMVFPRAARVYGIAISVDLGVPQMTTVEIAAGVGVTEHYGYDKNIDQYEQGGVAWLLHTSSSLGADIDQQVMFPKPIDLAPGEFVTVSGWIRNEDAEQVRTAYPETIVYYEWA